MRQIRIHAEPDWCHICGRQDANQVDVYYPEDARCAGSCTPNTKYLRLCQECIAALQAAVPQDR